MRLIGISIGLSILGSLGGVIVASSFLLLGESIRVRLVPWLISYAVGTLIGVALLALVPEALAALPARPAMLTMAAGILSFFLLEKAVIWRHCHDDEGCHVHTTAASLVIVGDAFHTFVDGAVNGVGGVFQAAYRGMHRAQTGRTQNYALTMATGIFGFVCLYLLLK